MKKSLIIFAAVLMLAGFTSKVMAQATDTKSNDANAQILGAIALTAVNPLEFGGLVASTGGTVVMSTAGVRSVGSGAVTLISSTVTPTAASYTVTGTGLTSYAITIPTASFDVTNTTGAGAETMTVTAMDCSKGAVSAFAANGTDAFTVGGTLTVGSAQVPGVYTGTFDVTVAY